MHKYRERIKAEAKKRRQAIIRLRKTHTLEQVAEIFKISKQRVSYLELQEKQGRKQE
jgi:DNA-directed RNA polymerase sigma subunit (sigma70/sigma32)